MALSSPYSLTPHLAQVCFLVIFVALLTVNFFLISSCDLPTVIYIFLCTPVYYRSGCTAMNLFLYLVRRPTCTVILESYLHCSGQRCNQSYLGVRLVVGYSILEKGTGSKMLLYSSADRGRDNGVGYHRTTEVTKVTAWLRVSQLPGIKRRRDKTYVLHPGAVHVM